MSPAIFAEVTNSRRTTCAVYTGPEGLIEHNRNILEARTTLFRDEDHRSAGGAGTAGAAFSGNKDIVLPAESALTFKLEQPLEVR